MNNSCFRMYGAALVISSTLLFLGCRETTPIEGDQPRLGAPRLLVNVGLLKSPRGIAVDPSGDIWVSNTYENKIMRYTPSGSTRSSITGVQFPGSMGIDRGTNTVLVTLNRTTLARLNPLNDQVTIITTLNGAVINSESVFDVVSRQQRTRSIALNDVGDLDGTSAGDIFVSVRGNATDNFLVRVRDGTATAVAFSEQAPIDTLSIGVRFVANDNFNSIFTEFVLPNTQGFGVIQPYVFNPGSVAASHTFSAPEISGGARGACVDVSGTLYVADATSGALVVISTTAERTVDVIDIPFIPGMTQPVPWDVAAAPNGTIYVAVVDLLDSAHELGAVLKYSPSTD